MTSLWMLLLVCSLRRGFGLSFLSDFYRQRFPPAKLHRLRSSTRSAGIVRHQIDCHSATNPSNGHVEKIEPMDGVYWLSRKDSKGSHRLAYRHVLPSNDGSKASPVTVLFCNGFRSSMTSGTKAVALEDFCSKKEWEFCSFDYRGHGLSSGKFEDCTLTDWIRDASDILDHVLLTTKEDRKRVVLVGSSMGAWISIHLALRYNKSGSGNSTKAECPVPIAGILGIASGPDFLQDFYSLSSVEQKAEWKSNGIVHLPSRYGDPYPIPWSLVEDAAQHWGILLSTKPILSKESPVASELSVRCPVRLLHGKCDEDISWEKSDELVSLLKGSIPENNKSKYATGSNDAILTLIDDGDHRLSRPQDIELLLFKLDELVTSI